MGGYTAPEGVVKAEGTRLTRGLNGVEEQQSKLLRVRRGLRE